MVTGQCFDTVHYKDAIKLQEAIADALLAKLKRRPKEGYKAILSLVKENVELRSRIAQIRISLDIMKTVMNLKGLDTDCPKEYEKIIKSIKESK